MPEEAERRPNCRFTVKDILNFIGSLLVPLLLAIFTVVITFEQRGEAHQQRLQDLHISREQREQDKWIAEKQREHDRNITDEKRNADDINAEKQRNMSLDQRRHELEVEQQRYEQERTKYLDNLLLSYYNEIGQLLKESSGKLSSNSITSALARAKTVNVIEQVGPQKSIHLIKFLYDTNQLSMGNESLELSGAQLSTIDLSSLQILHNFSLIGANLTNALFVGNDLSNVRFVNVNLRGADFSRTNISFGFFKNVDLTKSTFNGARGHNLYFDNCQMEHIDFTNVHFDQSESSNSLSGFIDSTLSSSIFRNAILFSVPFRFCNMTAVDFTNANMKKANLTGSLLLFSSFRNAQLESTEFLSTNLSYADFRNSTCRLESSLCTIGRAVSLDNALMHNGETGKASSPLIYYQHPWCNSTVDLPSYVEGPNKWIAQPKNSVFLEHRTLTYPHLYRSECVFTAKKNISTQVKLTQSINLDKYMGLIRAGRAKATVRCRVGYDTNVFITQTTARHTELSQSEPIGLRWQEILHHRTEILLVSIRFHIPSKWESTWCLYVELYIESVIKSPGYQLLYPWDSTDL